MKVKLPFCLILLMITGVAWADTKTLYHMSATFNDYCIGGPFGTLFKTPQKAQRMCGLQYYDLVGPINQWGDYGLAKDGTTWITITALTKSCELKDIPGKGTNGTHNLGFPYSEKGAPKMVRRCINNCEVEDRRVAKNGEAHDKDYGGSVCVEIGSDKGCSADYTRMQTGAVCIQNPGEKDDTKYDDVTANPGDDNGSNGADGKGKQDGGGKGDENNQGKQPESGNGGDENKDTGQGSGNAGGGNQNGGQGGTGADSPRDSGSADEPVEDKDKNKDKDKPGKGKGKGGGGGGNHGDKDKDDKDKTDDGKGGDPKGGSGGGSNGKGSDDKDGGKDGKDNADGSPNGTGNGTGAGGDKDGQGSGISGGDCKSGKAPSCKGET